MPDCLLCKIAAGAIPAERVYENDDVVVFPDIHPAARVHVLVIPKRHFATTIDMAEDAPELFGAMMKAANEVARKKGIDRSGFRIIFNTNADGGQEIFHVHMHLLGGEPIGALRAR